MYREAIRFWENWTKLEYEYEEGYLVTLARTYPDGYFIIHIQHLESGEVKFTTDDFTGPIFGLENMFSALQNELSTLGLEKLSVTVEEVRNRLENPPAQIIDLGMTVEEYLDGLSDVRN